MNQTSSGGDRIFLHELTIECVIGFIDWERLVKQTVVVDLEMPIDCRRAALSDEVADTLDYKKVSKLVLAFVSAPNFISSRRSRSAWRSVILEEFGIEWVRVTLNKPGAIRNSRDVGVVISARAPTWARAPQRPCSRGPEP